MSRIVVRDLVAFPEEADRPTAGDRLRVGGERLRDGARLVVERVREVQAAHQDARDGGAEGSETPIGR